MLRLVSLRRRPKPEKVRHTLRNIPPAQLANEYGEEIIRLRGAMKQAHDLLALGTAGIAEARLVLGDALEYGRWRK